MKSQKELFFENIDEAIKYMREGNTSRACHYIERVILILKDMPGLFAGNTQLDRIMVTAMDALERKDYLYLADLFEYGLRPTIDSLDESEIVALLEGNIEAVAH